MKDNNKNQLVDFMQKQAVEKMHKKAESKANKNINIKSDAHNKSDSNSSNNSDNQETDEEKKLEEAKKESRSKANQRDQYEMLKKLFFQNLLKYAIIITCFGIFAFGVIKIGPEILKHMNGFIIKLFIGSNIK